jgi:hypothetical protein
MTILETLQGTNGLAYLAPQSINVLATNARAHLDPQSVTKKKRSSIITLIPGQWPQLELLLVDINRPLPILGSCRKSSKLEDGVIGTVRGQLLVRRFSAENSEPRLELETRFHNSTRCHSYKTFFVRNFRIFVISYSVCPLQAFPAYSNKYSILVQKFVNYGQKSFITLAPGVGVIKRHRFSEISHSVCSCKS